MRTFNVATLTVACDACHRRVRKMHTQGKGADGDDELAYRHHVLHKPDHSLTQGLMNVR